MVNLTAKQKLFQKWKQIGALQRKLPTSAMNKRVAKVTDSTAAIDSKKENHQRCCSDVVQNRKNQYLNLYVNIILILKSYKNHFLVAWLAADANEISSPTRIRYFYQVKNQRANIQTNVTNRREFQIASCKLWSPFTKFAKCSFSQPTIIITIIIIINTKSVANWRNLE